MLQDAPEEGKSTFRSIRMKAEISESPWSESAQTFARGCIQACVQHHDMCGSGASILPTRVIEVGNIGDERLQLYETQENTTGQYTALSYCWGTDQPLKLTSTNIEDMKSGLIRISQLPQTLSDAVHVTRSLGIPYLWVDALCIIQDNVEDWETQSEQMSTIYEKAHVVIGASSSSSATQGFLNHRRQQQAYRMRLPDRYGPKISVAARSYPQSGFHSSEICKEADPLAKRAWAFQEQHMSTRYLLFSVDELQWVCKTKIACECGMAITPTFEYHPLWLSYCGSDDDTQQQQGEEKDLTGGRSSRKLLELQDAWRKAVSEYSNRRLTRAGDKLPAFSGLASRFGARMRSRYVAGLWRENIVQDLAWARMSWFDEESTLMPLPAEYRAPSFSWASIDDRVCYYFSIYPLMWSWISCCSVSDARAVVPGRNPFGRVSDAWITIRGPMARGFIEPDQESLRFCSDDREINLYLDLDCAVTEFSYAAQGDDDKRRSMRRYRSPQPSGECAEIDNTSHCIVEPGRANENTHFTLAQASVWLLHLGRWSKDKAASHAAEESHDYYLVLGKSPRDPQKYERIGSCSVSSGEPIASHTIGFTTSTITIL